MLRRDSDIVTYRSRLITFFRAKVTNESEKFVFFFFFDRRGIHLEIGILGVDFNRYFLLVKKEDDRLDGFGRLIVFQLICTKGYKLLCYIACAWPTTSTGYYNCIVSIIKDQKQFFKNFYYLFDEESKFI